MEMGYTLTRKGRELIAESLALQAPVVWMGVVMGEGLPDEGTDLADVEQLVAPVAAGTSTLPDYQGDRVRMILEYRSDLNGGIGRGFWIKEFGVFAKLGTEADKENDPVLVVYGCQGDYPVWVGDIEDGARDIRRWPITIVIGSGVVQDMGYPPQAFMTAEDIDNYVTWHVLPDLRDRLWELIEKHNVNPDAHAGLMLHVQNVESELARLKLQVGTGITTNPFSVTFASLDGLDVEGIWNAAKSQMSFGTEAM